MKTTLRVMGFVGFTTRLFTSCRKSGVSHSFRIDKWIEWAYKSKNLFDEKQGFAFVNTIIICRRGDLWILGFISLITVILDWKLFHALCLTVKHPDSEINGTFGEGTSHLMEYSKPQILIKRNPVCWVDWYVEPKYKSFANYLLHSWQTIETAVRSLRSRSYEKMQNKISCGSGGKSTSQYLVAFSPRLGLVFPRVSACQIPFICQLVAVSNFFVFKQK